MAEKKKSNHEIGFRIKMSREQLGYTQEKFAENVGVSTQYISDLERGKAGMSVNTLIIICDTLHVTSDYILFGKTDYQDIDPVMKLLKNLSDRELLIVKSGIRVILRALAEKPSCS